MGSKFFLKKLSTVLIYNDFLAMSECPPLSAKSSKSLIYQGFFKNRLSRLVANQVAKTMKIPVYARPETGIYCLHTRIAGRQIKRSLHTRNRSLAMLRALEFFKAIATVDSSKFKKFEMDIGRGIYKSEDGDVADREALLEAMRLALGQGQGAAVSVPQTASNAHQKGLRLSGLLSKFLNLKNLETRSIQQYTTNINEFANFLDDPFINKINGDDITRFQEHLKENGNTLRTIDNKISVIRTVFNFAIKQGYYFEVNPAQGRNLMSKRDKAKSTYATFYIEEVVKIFNPEQLKVHKEKDPDFYFVMLMALVTGCRIGEITALNKRQFFKTEKGTAFIRIEEAKTEAGVREVPLPSFLMKELEPFIQSRKLPDGKIFKYRELEGKGAGNAAGKKFSRYIKSIGVNRPKLVFHSLRKFFNNYMKEQGVPVEMRCQIVGHEFEGTNSEIYSQAFPFTQIEETLAKVQFNLLMKIDYIKTKF